MYWASRVSLCLLALNLIITATSQFQSLASSPTQSSDEEISRALVDKYFVSYAAEDLDGVMSLWSEKSPDYASHKQNLQRQFATEDFSVSDTVISRIKVESGKVSLRVTANLTAINRKSNQKREQPIARNFAFLREDEKWKVWRVAPAEEDLAEALMKTRTEAERIELLAEEKELVAASLVHALRNRAERFYGQGDPAQALMTFNLAQSIAEQIGDRLQVARMVLLIGHVHRLQGNFAQAMEFFQKSLAINEAIEERAGIASTRIGFGLVHDAQGNYTKALEYYQKSLTIFEALDSKTAIATLLNNIGNVHRSQGDYVQALKYYQKSLGISQELNHTHGVLSSLGNIGVVYGSQGNFAKALDYYQRSLAMSEAEDDKQGIAITLGNIGVLYRKQGNYEQALDYYRKSLAKSESIEDKVGIAQMVNNIGTVHLQQGDYAEALDYYRKALAMREQSGDRQGTSDTMMAIGVIHTTQGNYEQAWEYFQKSLTIKEDITDRSGIANLLDHISIYHRKQGHNSQALDFAERATTLAREVGNLYLLWSTQVNAGLAYRALNQPDKARLAFEEAIAVIETMRGQVAGSEQAQQRFFEDKLSPYHTMVDLLVARNNPTEALIFTERAKARALLDLLYSGRVNIVKAMTGQEQEQERALRAEVISLNTQMNRASQRDRPDQARLDELKSQLEKARLSYEAFQTSLYAAHPELKVKRGQAPVIKTDELASLLPDSTSALLQYTVTEEKTYLFVITKSAAKSETHIQVYTLAVKRADLAKEIESFRLQLARRDLGFRPSAIKLYGLLMGVAEAQLRGKTNLIIAADDTLWDLPFQALMKRSNRYVIEESAISYAPSLTVLREMMKRAEKGGEKAGSTNLLALGNPVVSKEKHNRATLRDERLAALPEAEEEVMALRQLYGTSQSRVYTGAEAGEERVKREAGEARIVHFAAHGMINNASPMYSHLVLAEGGGKEDGLLEAWEMMEMEMKAEMVVLSACETARGRIGAGEGMVGMSWAMFIAGVPTMVVSQWKVEAAGTKELMVNFHRGLVREDGGAKRKMRKAEALRGAAMKLMKTAGTRHPFYWAGFVLVGDGR